MGAGVALMVVGAILAFAVDDNLPGVKLPIVGLILMIAGVGVIAHARHGSMRERVITRRDEGADPDTAPRVVQETFRERDTD
jgi:hypothetical protein